MTKIILGARWIALGSGLVALFQPVSKLAARNALQAYNALMAGELVDGKTAGDILDADKKGDDAPSTEQIQAATDRLAAANEAYTCALAREGILAWGQFTGEEGEPITTEKVDRSVVVDDAGNVLEPTPAAIDQFMAIAEIFDAVDDAYVVPYVAKVIEKNVSSRLPTGSSVSAGTTTAAPASN